MKRRKRRLFVADVDRTMFTSPIPYPRAQRVERRVVCEIGEELDVLSTEHGVMTALLSDKPAGQFPPIVHLVLGASAGRWHCGESGGARYDAVQYYVEPHPDYLEYRGEVRKGLVRNAREGGVWRPEPGYKLVSATVLSAGPWGDEGVATGAAFLRKLDGISAVSPAMASGEIALRPGEDGNIVTFSPASLTKRVGAAWLIESYAGDAFSAGEAMDWENSIWVGDSLADLPAAQRFHKQGMLVAAVGNADSFYKDYVLQCGERGYVASSDCEHGFLECMHWYRARLQQLEAATDTAVGA